MNNEISNNNSIDPRDDAIAEADATFERLTNDPELTPEKLAEELAAYTYRLKQEFEAKQAADPENVAEYTTEFFKKNVASAAAQIVWLSNNAESETVSLRASQYVVDIAREQEEAGKDPVKDLLKKLQANDSKSPVPQED